jgi:hypothetical protein
MCNRVSGSGPPMTLGRAATAKVCLIVWCRDCQHQVEPDPAEHAARYGAELPVGQAAQMLAVRRPKRRFRADRGAAVASSAKPPWPPRTFGPLGERR